MEWRRTWCGMRSDSVEPHAEDTRSELSFVGVRRWDDLEMPTRNAHATGAAHSRATPVHALLWHGHLREWRPVDISSGHGAGEVRPRIGLASGPTSFPRKNTKTHGGERVWLRVQCKSIHRQRVHGTFRRTRVKPLTYSRDSDGETYVTARKGSCTSTSCSYSRALTHIDAEHWMLESRHSGPRLHSP